MKSLPTIFCRSSGLNAFLQKDQAFADFFSQFTVEADHAIPFVLTKGFILTGAEKLGLAPLEDCQHDHQLT
jgi:hypothetical protein